MDSEKLSLYIANKIKTFRKERRMTQMDLAEKLGVGKQTISKYEKAIIKAQQSTLFQLSDIFGVSVNDFFPSNTAPLSALKFPIPYTDGYLDDVLVRMAYHSSGIEGNTISLPETVSIILENALPTGRKSVCEFYEIDNHKGAFSYVLDLLGHHAPLSVAIVLGIHERLTDRLQHDKGRFKTYQNAIIGAEFQTASPQEVYPLMLQWCDNTQWRLDNAKSVRDKLEALADSHIQFERVHPFSDGNGRTGRLLVLYLAMVHLDAPVIVSKDKRADYMEYLANQDSKALSDLFGKSLEAEKDRLGQF